VVSTVGDCGRHPVAAFFHGDIRQAHNDDHGIAMGAIHLDLYFVRIHTVNGT